MGAFTHKLKDSLPKSVHLVDPGEAWSIIDSEDPIQFWGQLGGILAGGRAGILVDPAWPDKWKSRARKLVHSNALPDKPSILIPTSGSSGEPKFCIHDLNTLMYAANAFIECFLASGIIHSVSLLPQHHVGGLMPVLRSIAGGGRTIFADYRDPDFSADAPFPLDKAALSLVPTQLHRLLQSDQSVERLRQFGVILIGGAACPPHLLQQARLLNLRLSPCYGSTETAALVTLLHPDAFLAGVDGVGTALPGMQILLDNDQRIQIRSESVCRGYLPQRGDFIRDPYPTTDLGRFDADHNLHILGRADRVIVSGGEKIHPEQVERAALASDLVRDAWCEGRSDPDWGMRVELDIVPDGSAEGIADKVRELLQESLPPYAIPKIIRPVTHLPRSAMGKRRRLDD